MRTTVKNWGNSAAVRIPAPVMAAANLHVDAPVALHVEGGRIVIEPLSAGKYDLASLLAGVTAENLHAGVDFGTPVGKETL